MHAWNNWEEIQFVMLVCVSVKGGRVGFLDRNEWITAVNHPDWPMRLFLRLWFWILLFSVWQGSPTTREHTKELVACLSLFLLQIVSLYSTSVNLFLPIPYPSSPWKTTALVLPIQAKLIKTCASLPTISQITLWPIQDIVFVLQPASDSAAVISRSYGSLLTLSWLVTSGDITAIQFYQLNRGLIGNELTKHNCNNSSLPRKIRYGSYCGSILNLQAICKIHWHYSLNNGHCNDFFCFSSKKV